MRLRGLTTDGVRIEGGLLGASFSTEEGLTVWNLGSRNRKEDIKVKDLRNIEKELMKLFKGDEEEWYLI